MAATLRGKVGRREVGRARNQQALHASDLLAVMAENAGHVIVDVQVRAGMDDLGLLRNAVSATQELPEHAATKAATKVLNSTLKTVATDFFSRVFSAEIQKVVDAYRVMLRESLAKGEDPMLQAALNKARLQERILAGTSMVDQPQACQLLGLSATNASATMKRKEDRQEILRFTTEGRAVYPLFQFDVEGRQLFPSMARLIARKPKDWSDFRLLHWLTRPHLDMDGMPAEALGTDGDAVLAAFDLEIEPEVHG